MLGHASGRFAIFFIRIIIRAAGFNVYRVVSCRIEYLDKQTSYGKFHWTQSKSWTVCCNSFNVGGGRFEVTLYSSASKFPKRIILHSWGLKTVVYRLVELVDNETQIFLSEERQKFKWVDLGEASQLSHHADFQNVLRECDVYLKGKKTEIVICIQCTLITSQLKDNSLLRIYVRELEIK